MLAMVGGLSFASSSTGNSGIVEIAYGIFGPCFQY